MMRSLVGLRLMVVRYSGKWSGAKKPSVAALTGVLMGWSSC